MNITIETPVKQQASILFPVELYDRISRYVKRYHVSKQLAARVIMEYAIKTDLLSKLTDEINNEKLAKQQQKRSIMDEINNLVSMSDREYFQSVRRARTEKIFKELPPKIKI